MMVKLGIHFYGTLEFGIGEETDMWRWNLKACGGG